MTFAAAPAELPLSLMILSSTTKVSVFKVVVLPLIITLPVTVRSPETRTFPSLEIEATVSFSELTNSANGTVALAAALNCTDSSKIVICGAVSNLRRAMTLLKKKFNYIIKDSNEILLKLLCNSI
ncbi:MAG: hypothetical protein FJX80_05305 [Bacteroidetes bacterium]|nr:hypothetical protein [Bacteroidota bacterium]